MEFLLRAGGRSLPEAAMTMVPEAWEKDDDMTSTKKHFYRWSAMSMEPWDGPGDKLFWRNEIGVFEDVCMNIFMRSSRHFLPYLKNK